MSTRIKLTCACGVPHEYTRDAFNKANRLGRIVACEPCRRSRVVAPGDRGRTGYSRSLNDKIFKPGTGRKGFGAFTADGRMLATHTSEAVLRGWYRDLRIERI